ncbi:MAG: hypothetical protein ACI9OH_002957 [Oleispira sp.]|jgi:hypothetical protein
MLGGCVARILLCWELGADYQHLLTLQSVARFYHSKGYDVWVAARDVSKLKRLFSDVSINIVAAPFTDSAAELGVEKQAPRSYADFLRRCGFHQADALSGLVSAWRSLFSFIKPDLLFCDHAPVALLSARGLSFAGKVVGKVAVGMPFSVPDDNRPAGVFFTGDLAKNDIVRYEDDLVKVINKVCIEFSISRINNLAELFADFDKCIFQTYSELDHYGYRSAEQRYKTSYVGTALPEFSEPAIFPHFKGPKIYCHVKGSIETPILLKTLQAIECSAIVLVDGIPDSIVNAHRSKHILYVDKPVSMSDVLSKSTFAILNGGINSVSLFMKAGIPVALFPLHIEQFLMAKRLEALNAGIQLNLTDVDSALKGLQKVNSRQKKVAAGLFEEKYQAESAHNELLLQLALVEQNFLFEKLKG